MKKLLLLIVLIFPQLLKAGTTVIHVETEGWGTITDINSDTANTRGAFFWNGTKWVTNETAAHMFFTDLRTGERLKEYNLIDVSDRTATLPVFDTLSYNIIRQNYQYSYPAKQGGNYQYEAVEYLIGDATAKKVVIRSRGTGNGIANSYFDIFVEVVHNEVTAIRNDPQWFTYPAGMSMAEALEQTSPTQYLTGNLPTTDGYYFMDQNGGSDMGGLSYNFHTGPLTGNPNTDDLSPSYPTDFMLKFMDSKGQLEELKFLPELISETYLPPVAEATTFVLTNEGGLIDELIAKGYGDSCLYDVMVALQPASGGTISDEFLATLAACLPGSDIFTAAFKYFAGLNNPVCINTDGTITINGIFGKDYFGKVGYTTYTENHTGVGRELFTRAISPDYYIDAGFSGISGGTSIHYYAFAIAWSSLTEAGSNAFVPLGMAGSYAEGSEVDGLYRDFTSSYPLNYAASKPIVSTEKIVDITAKSAVVFANVAISGGFDVTERGIVYASSPDPTTSNGTKLIAGSGTGLFSASITGLLPNVTYYSRAYAKNSLGTGYGTSCSFSTPVRVDTLKVGLLPQALAVNSVTDKIYVSNSVGNSVSVINGDADSALSTIGVGHFPYALAINDITNRIYVVNNLDNTVSVINGNVDTVFATINVGGGPRALAINKATNKIYVSNYTSNTVSVISGITNTVIATVTVGSGPIALIVNELSNKIYVANYFSGNSVTVIDGNTNTTQTIPVGSNPRYLTVNSATNKIYVVNYRSKNVTVIDGSLNTTLNIPVGSFPWAAAVNEETNKLFVTNSGDNTVSVIDGATNTTDTIYVGDAPQAIAVNKVTNTIYVGNYNRDESSIAGYTITRIDGNTNEISGFANKSNPAELAVNETTNKIYVANIIGNNLTVIADFAKELSVSHSTLNVASTAGSTATFNIISNTEWTVSSNQTWLTASKASGSGNGKLTVDGIVNSTISERTATVTISVPGLASKTINVTQAAGQATLSVSPTTLNVASTGGSTSYFNISSNTTWTVSSNQTWLIVSKASGSANGTLTVTSIVNPTVSERIATVTISATGMSSKAVTVTQAAGVATLSVSPTTLNVALAAGSTATFTVFSNTTWSAASNQSWLTVKPASGTENGTVTITSEKNPSTTERVAIVTVSATAVSSQTITITQMAGVGTLAVSLTSLNVAAVEGSNATFSVSSNITWSASSNQTWLSINPITETGDGNVTVTTESNPTVSERIAIITVSANGLVSKTVTVTQAAGTTILLVSTSNLDIGVTNGSYASFDVISNTAWSVSSDQTWLTINPVSGSGDGVVTLILKANPLASELTAVIIVSATGATSQNIAVTQAAMVGISSKNIAEILVYPNPFDEGFYVNTGNIPSIVSVFDIRGRLLLTRKISGIEFIPSIQFENGIYLLKLTNDLVTIKKKLIKN